MGIEKDSFYNGSTQIMAYKKDGLMIPPAPIDSYIIFKGGTLDTQEKTLPIADLKSVIQPVSVFFQYTGSNPSVTFRIKQLYPSLETINELTVTSSGYTFPLMVLDPQLYSYTVQVSSNVKNLFIFLKFADIYSIYSIS